MCEENTWLDKASLQHFMEWRGRILSLSSSKWLSVCMSICLFLSVCTHSRHVHLLLATSVCHRSPSLSIYTHLSVSLRNLCPDPSVPIRPSMSVPVRSSTPVSLCTSVHICSVTISLLISVPVRLSTSVHPPIYLSIFLRTLQYRRL